ncbi:hypothetical protein [Flavobacterium psychrophilum]|uniref:hypothetical protein n=1 Tax=Flavobacterium psychrophilum TaxID=96345 RepID=UPI000B7C3259|nr:hypothetical protein [Flavobacterium psychrophilum]SNA77375.1 conserved hypothetical protein [Flavobacterium psychrophilum]
MTTNEILQIEFESIKIDLIKKHNILKMKASGKWENSLVVNVLDLKDGLIMARVYGEKYTEQLVNGRIPGKFPPIQVIKDWIINKGIAGVMEKAKVSSIAFLIARKIAKEGTKYFKDGGTDLVSSVYTPERIQRIIDKVGEINLTYITNGLIEQFKAAA